MRPWTCFLESVAAMHAGKLYSPHSSAVARSPLAGLTLDKCYLYLDVSKDNFFQDEQINSKLQIKISRFILSCEHVNLD